MVSFTCPCWGRGDCEVDDCRFAVDGPEGKPFCPGLEETALGAEMAVETGCPLMIWVTTCWGVPNADSKTLQILTCPRQYFEMKYSSTHQMNVFFSIFKKDLWDAKDACRHIPTPKAPASLSVSLFLTSSLITILQFLLTVVEWKNNTLPRCLKQNGQEGRQKRMCKMPLIRLPFLRNMLFFKNLIYN